MGERFVSGALARRFRLRVIPLRFARGIGDLGRVGVRKVLLAALCGVRALGVLATGRADVAYITPGANGPAMVRDAAYMYLFRLFRIPYVTHLQVMGLPDRLRSASWPTRRWVVAGYRAAEAVVVVNQAQAGEMEALSRPGRIEVVPNAVPDFEPASGGERESGAVPGRVLFLSNMMEEKGPFVLLAALPRILAAAPGVTATFAGAFPDPASEATFRARAMSLGVADQVEIAGPVGEERKLRLLREARVFVFPSHYPLEATPLAVAEAMRQGLPIVATWHAGVPEMLEGCGLLVPPRNPAALAEAVERVLAEPRLARDLGAAAREAYERGYRIDRWEERLEKILQRAAAPR